MTKPQEMPMSTPLPAPVRRATVPWPRTDRARRGVALVLAALGLVLTALLSGLADGRDRQLTLMDRQLAALRQGIPAPQALMALQAEFKALQAAQTLRLQTVAAIGLTGLALAASLVVSLVVSPRVASKAPRPAQPLHRPTDPMSQAVAELEQAVDEACRLAARLRPAAVHPPSEPGLQPGRR
jgi:hypothetical protein